MPKAIEINPKGTCIACRRSVGTLTKEHFWPKWLIEFTNTSDTKIRWLSEQKIVPGSTVIRICEKCNNEFGKYLEKPVKRIFISLLDNNGITDFEAEILIRWMWKFEGLAWMIHNPSNQYSQKYTLHDRVLFPIDEIREHLVLAISRISEIDSSFIDQPLGLDSYNQYSGVFVSGVFSRIAIIVALDRFADYIPDRYFSKYHLQKHIEKKHAIKTCFPKCGFTDDCQAVTITLGISKNLTSLHDEYARKCQRNEENFVNE